jgi:hypothetical protein
MTHFFTAARSFQSRNLRVIASLAADCLTSKTRLELPAAERMLKGYPC